MSRGLSKKQSQALGLTGSNIRTKRQKVKQDIAKRKQSVAADKAKEKAKLKRAEKVVGPIMAVAGGGATGKTIGKGLAKVLTRKKPVATKPRKTKSKAHTSREMDAILKREGYSPQEIQLMKNAAKKAAKKDPVKSKRMTEINIKRDAKNRRKGVVSAVKVGVPIGTAAVSGAYLLGSKKGQAKGEAKGKKEKGFPFTGKSPKRKRS